MFAIYSRILALRQEKDMTQKEFAKATGVPWTSFSNFESGRRKISLDALLKISLFCQVSVEYLIGQTDCRLTLDSYNDIFLVSDDKKLTNGEFYEKLGKLSAKHRSTINSMVDLMIGAE